MMSDIRFKDFEDVLATAGGLADAAEAHGSLCGALCSMSPYKMQDWINEILPDGAAVSARVVGHDRKGVHRHRDILRRAGHGIRAPAARRRTAAQRPRQCTCIMVHRISLWTGYRTISRIWKPWAATSEKSSATSPKSRAPRGDDAEADESNEQAYAELVEFIRVAAQVVFEELLPLRRQVYPAQQRLH